MSKGAPVVKQALPARREKTHINIKELIKNLI
jgi:hypothetical protein